jgi:hypothetical protein
MRMGKMLFALNCPLFARNQNPGAKSVCVFRIFIIGAPSIAVKRGGFREFVRITSSSIT